MKTTHRILVATLVAALSLPIAAYAAKGDRKKPEAGTEAFAKADTNKDGDVSEEEFSAAMGGKGGKNVEAAKKRFSALDKDSNGKLSKEEFAAVAERKKKKKDA